MIKEETVGRNGVRKALIDKRTAHTEDMGEPLTFDGVDKEFFSGGRDEILGFFLFFGLGFQYPG